MRETANAATSSVQRYVGLREMVERHVSQHGEQDVAAPSGQRDEDLIVTLKLTDLAGVVSLGGWITQGREGRQVHHSLQLLVISTEGPLSADG